jgi:RNA polymerase sigma-70 factor (ECF subfamily)
MSPEAYRTYLLGIAQRELDSSLRAKTGASDVVQDALLAAHQARGDFRGDSPVQMRFWLRTILIRKLTDLARRLRGRGRGAVEGGVSLDREEGLRDGLADDEESPSACAVRREIEARVSAAIDALPERDRLIVRWRSIDHCDWDDIAARLGMNVEAVRKAWSRAVHKLRVQLDADSPFPSGGRGDESRSGDARA